jgi:predicted DNA-binding protein YlxM (UPF0122 family)
MKTNLLDAAYLFDFYADILTDKQRDYLDLYYHQDLSLSEIAENEGITRQGVRDVISRAEGVLRNMENKLGLVARYGHVRRNMELVSSLAEEILALGGGRYASTDVSQRAERILALTEPMTQQTDE